MLEDFDTLMKGGEIGAAVVPGKSGESLLIDAVTGAEGQAPGLIPVQPEDELSIGEDSQTAVGDYPPPHPLRGTISGVRVVPE